MLACFHHVFDCGFADREIAVPHFIFFMGGTLLTLLLVVETEPAGWDSGV